MGTKVVYSGSCLLPRKFLEAQYLILRSRAIREFGPSAYGLVSDVSELHDAAVEGLVYSLRRSLGKSSSGS